LRGIVDEPGPANVMFAYFNSPVTTATFSSAGIYVRQLDADDAVKSVRDQTEARVDTVCSA
jgi:hypothetical protein